MPSNSNDGIYSLSTLGTNVIDRLLVDVYSLIKDDAHILQVLLALRHQLRVCNNKITILFTQVGLPLTDKIQLINDHNAFIKPKAEIMVSLINQVLDILKERYDLTTPFEI